MIKWGREKVAAKKNNKEPLSRSSSSIYKTLSIPVFGAARVGKSSVIKGFLNEPYEDDYKPTIEEYFTKYLEYREKQFQLNIIDTGGSESFPAMRRLEIERADLIILMYSLEHSSTFEYLAQIREEINEIHGNKKPVIVVANKSDQDVQGKSIEYITTDGKKMNTKRLVELEWGYLWTITSARMNWGVEGVFTLILDEFLKRKAQSLPKRSTSAAANAIKKISDFRAFGK